ncbi:MAG: hypothetical protein HUU35_02145, partial [Armatimonadetes bacterium]|nr:hypothetical protein [Armatimonadota bacterium]
MVEPQAQEYEASLPGPGTILGIVVLVGLFGAVSGTHVLQLLAGHGSFLTTTQIERLVPGQSLATIPLPPAALATHERVGRLALIGGTPWMLASTLIAGLLAGAAVIRILHPTLWADVRRGRVARWRLVVALFATAAVLVAALWELPAPVMRTTFPISRAAMAGGLLWLIWHRHGWLHAVHQPPGLFRIAGHLVCGAAVGLVAHRFLRHTISPSDLQILESWLEYGYWSPVTWRELAIYSIGLHCWGGLLAGTLAALLGQSDTRLAARLLRVALPAMLVLLAVIAGETWRREQWQQRFRLTAPLETLLPLPAGPPGA